MSDETYVPGLDSLGYISLRFIEVGFIIAPIAKYHCNSDFSSSKNHEIKVLFIYLHTQVYVAEVCVESVYLGVG